MSATIAQTAALRASLAKLETILREIEKLEEAVPIHLRLELRAAITGLRQASKHLRDTW